LRDFMSASPSRGAEVTVHWENAGHQLTSGDLDAGRMWLGREGAP
jgi:predicted esterase